MPYKYPEDRKRHVKEQREKLLANPEAHRKYKEWHRQYYISNRRQFLGYQKKYQKRTAKDPKRIAANRKAYRKYYYAWKSKTPEYNKHMREYGKNRLLQLREKVFRAYGAHCKCCGESILEFLTVDHVNGGGGKHLKRRGICGIYLDIILAGFPKDYQILCMNCNFAKGRFGRCPHGNPVKA